MSILNPNANLTVIIPVLNEEKTIRKILQRVIDNKYVREIIVINDGSSDRSGEIINKFKKKLNIIENPQNIGKGYSVQKGIKQATGKYIIVQDADLEYNPKDYKKLLDKMEATNCDLINSIRERKSKLFLTKIGQVILPLMTYLIYQKYIRDVISCYKLMTKEKWVELDLQSNGFDLETEIITKAIRKNYKISEVEISYEPRTNNEGKHIRWTDGLKIISALLKFRFQKL